MSAKSLAMTIMESCLQKKYTPSSLDSAAKSSMSLLISEIRVFVAYASKCSNSGKRPVSNSLHEQRLLQKLKAILAADQQMWL